MALINPIKAILGTSDAFKAFERGSSGVNGDINKENQTLTTSSTSDASNATESGVDLRLPKLIYVAIQIAALAMGVYKCSTMGLLPLTSADWTHYVPQPAYQEHSVFPL